MELLSSKCIVALGIIAFLAMSFWSLSSMSMDAGGRMVNCPFMNGSFSLCQMNVAEHLGQWQQFFTIIKNKNLLLFSLLVLLSFAIVFATREEKLKFQKFRGYFYRYNPELKLFDQMLLALSKGTVHPKICAY